MIGLALCVGLSGCGGGETVGEALGYQQRGPDEMSVIKRPPLIVPPDFNLRPPRPGEPRSEANAASRAARETLIGPSSSELASETPDEAGVALVNASPVSDASNDADIAETTAAAEQRYDKSPPLKQKGEQVAKVVDEPPSAGQTALLSRTNRVERDIDELTETRAENRVDGALLRRLLTWQSAPASAEDGVDDGKNGVESQKAVEIVRREQTPITSDANLE